MVRQKTDVTGFAADSVRHVMASPLKRWWWENWFRPVARIGKRGNYEHVLRPAAPLTAMEHLTAMEVKKCPPQPPKEKWEADIPSPADEDFKSWELACEATNNIKPNRTLISDITADAIGELFIYVNDAVLALSGLTDVFYRNNSGTAKVTVTRVLADSIVESPAEGK
ncbi:MAG: hypothetical protein USCAAHI_00725 [Beijerinckiaceae bacterium]|nr:MAG: hypothetical protein USCAAHI_00725 [Beijerinckiaceae bacterium]